MKRMYKILIIFVLFSIFILFSGEALAQSYLPLVPCGRKGQDNPATPQIEGACTRCDLFRVAANVILFIGEGLAPPVAAVLFIAAGLMIILAGANPSMYARGIAIFKTTFFG